MIPELQPGDVVERYRVEAVLGRGGMAVVYRVKHTSLATSHALKVVSSNSPQIISRMLEEGRMQASLQHENILAVRDVLDVSGAPGLLMDLVQGGSLAELLEQGPLPPERRKTLFRAILEGVTLAHSRGMVHRDLKPANILMSDHSDRARPMIADFGLAKVLNDATDRAHQTQQGIAMGTPAYMAPEQVFDAATADLRADLWALGAILYELSTGRRAFTAATQLAVLSRVANGRYEDAETLAPTLDLATLSAIRGCLVVSPENRIPDCATLSAVLDGQPFESPEAFESLPGEAVVPLTGNQSETFFIDPVADTVPRPAGSPAPAFDPDATSHSIIQPVAPEVPTVPQPAPEPPAQPVATQHQAEPVPAAAMASWVAPLRRQWRWSLLLVPAFVAYSDLVWPVEARIQYPLLEAIHGPLKVDDAVVVSFEGMRSPEVLRPQVPALLDDLVEAGATAVLFDVALLSETEHDDAIADAIARADAADVPVILPAFADDVVPRLPGSASLRKGRLGLVEFQREMLGGTVVRAPMVRHTLDGRTFWHATVHAVHAHVGAKREPELQHNELVVGGTRNPSWAGLVWLHPVGDVPRVTWDQADTWGDQITGKVAVFGTFGGAADLHLTPSGPRYGTEIQAALIQTLVRQAGLWVVPLWINALIAVATGGLMGLAARALPRNRRVAAFAVPIAVVAVLIALIASRTMVALSPVFIAAAVAWFALRTSSEVD